MIFLMQINDVKTECIYLHLMKMDLKFISLGVLLLLLGFGAGYYLQTAPQREYLNPDIELSVDKDCELNQAACKTRLQGNELLSFSIEPRPIYGVSPLVFTLRTAQGMDIKNAVVDLSGTEMNMGSYRFEFESDGSGVFQAKGTLPVCIRNQMEWQAIVWLDSKQQGLIKAPYIFTAAKR